MANITILEVAKIAGVSKSAVADILGGKPKYRYRDDTIRRVQQAALETGYQANAAARLMRQREKTLVGLCVRVDQRATLNARVEAMYNELIARGYQPVLMEPSQFSATGGQLFPSIDLLAGIVSADLSMEETIPGFYHILQRRLPIVALYPVRCDGVDVVTTDSAQIVDIAVEHLTKLGHRRIVFLGPLDAENLSDKMKNDGWQQARKKYDLDLNPAYSMNRPNAFDEAGLISTYEQAKRIVEQLRLLRPRPTALVSPSEMLTLSLVGRLVEAGWRIPRDISIIGYGSGIFGEITAPPLTTVLQPTKEIARIATDLLIERITSQGKENDGHSPAGQRKFISPSLLVRKSTASPATDSHREEYCMDCSD